MDLVQDLAVIYHHKLRGPLIEGRRRAQAGFQQQFDVLCGNRVGRIIPDTAPGQDGGDGIESPRRNFDFHRRPLILGGRRRFFLSPTPGGREPRLPHAGQEA